MRKLYFFVLFLSNTLFCYGQVDTEFWFAPPDATSGHGDRPVFLHISTLNQAAIVRVTQPARGDAELANLTIPSNSTGSINLSANISNLETSTPGRVMQTGIRIISSAPVTAYYEVGSQWNSDIFALKGKNALGGQFIIPGQNLYNNEANWYNPLPYSSFDIVATRNNTIITIRPTRAVVGHVNEELITIRLNAGETYSFRKTTLLASDNAIGTVVTANKPIAITIKDDSVINGGCRDLLGDQLVPVEVAGSEYIVMKGFLASEENIFITATENNTKVYVGGNSAPAATLQAGEVFRRRVLEQATYVLADKRIYVCHVTGFGCEMGMAVLPSIDCKGSQQIGFFRPPSPQPPAIEFFGMNLMVRKEGIGGFTLNGQPNLIPASAFTAVPGAGDKWYAAQLAFNTSAVPENQASLIANTNHSFQVGIIGGDAQTRCRYGYFSSFSTLYIGDDFDLCEGESAILDAGTEKESYLWSTGATSQQIEVTDAGEYWVRTVKDECVLYDTLNVYKIDDRVEASIDFVTVDTADEKNINIQWTITPPNLGSVFLNIRSNGAANWQTFNTGLSQANEFTDAEMETDVGSYQYYVSMSHLCHEEEIASEVHNTIHLTGSTDAEAVISFSWTPYQGWRNGVERYELWRKLDDNAGYSFVTAIPGSENVYSDSLAQAGFQHSYVIRAVEAVGGKESWSNNIQFEFEHPLFVPNVITPEGDSKNEYFVIQKIEIYEQCELTIFDRWGGEVYHVRGYKNNWNGADLSTGVYYYVLDLKRKNKVLKGTVTILK